MGPTVGRFSRVGVLESVDNADLKSAGETRAGSSPAADTKAKILSTNVGRIFALYFSFFSLPFSFFSCIDRIF